MVESNVLLRLKVRRSTGTTIEFDHNSRIVALPCGPTGYSLRGYTSDMVIIDEANFVPGNVVESVIRPMLITRPSSRLIMLSTPVTKDHPFYRAVSQKEQGFHVYSWATRLNPLVTPEKLEAERNAVDESTFLKEYEAQFTEEANCYFPGHLILQCVDGEHELLKDEDVLQRKFQGNFNLGVDFGKRVDYTVLAVVEKLSNETLRLIYLKQLPLGTEYSSAVGWVKRLNEAFSPISCKLDRTGVGEAPAEDVKRIIPNMEGITLTTKVKVDLLSNLLVLMERKRLILPPDRELIAQISNQQYEVVKSGELLFSHPPRAHDDQLWALALSAWRTPNSWGSIIPVKKSF